MNKYFVFSLLVLSGLFLQGCKSNSVLDQKAQKSQSPNTETLGEAVNPDDEENSQDNRDDDGDDGTWGSGDTSSQNEAVEEPSHVVEPASETADIKEAMEKTVTGIASILEAAQQATVIDSETISPDEIVILEAVNPVEIEPAFEDQ